MIITFFIVYFIKNIVNPLMLIVLKTTERK